MPKSSLSRFLLFSILFSLFLYSCSADGIPGVVTITPPPPTPGPATQTPFALASPLPDVTLSTATPVIATATVSSPHFDSQNGGTEGGGLPLYVIDASMDYETKLVDVTQEITYPNPSADSLSSIVLAVEPNLLENVFHLASVSADGQKIETFTLAGQRLEVTLPSALAPGATLKLALAYSLTLPIIEQGDPNVVRPRIFGVAERQVNLVDWYPFIVPYKPDGVVPSERSAAGTTPAALPGTGWVLHKPWYYGEHLVYDKADFDVTLHFKSSKDLPVVAASAPAEPVSDGARYRLDNARDFSFSMGRQLKVISRQIEGGVTVYSYYLGDWNKPAAQAVLDATVKAVQTYSALFGPYPHKTLSAVEGDFADGMEFDGLYFLTAYNLYDQTEKNLMTTIAVHETAHQWWFGRVANDQAQEPWLDETLATYCERLFYEKNYPADVNWWWDFRINQYKPIGSVDTILYNGGGFRPYTNAVYFVGAYFLNALRKQIGDDAFFAFLKDYSAQMDGKIAAADDFFRILRTHTDQDISGLVGKYFLNAH